MSATIDERVVQMKFDNQEFESGVKQSLSTLEKLKLALRFDKGYEDSLNEISKATRNVSFDGMTTALDEVKNKFSALEVIGVTALVNITNQALNTGKQLIKSLSTDQISAGFDKYAEKTQSVQTIVNATGKSMEEVSEILQKLNLYTDETSYNFLDMVNNIGKFTSNQIPLEKAETAMEGIANWAAVSGANANEASRAMYNISQAVSAGSMKLMDWKSIENANMATAEFKQTAMETAAAMGTLKKNADGTFETLKGKQVTVKNFSTTLQDAWLSSEALIATLGKYGGANKKLFEISEATGLTVTKTIEAIDKYKAGTLDLNSLLGETDVTLSDLKGMFDEISSETYELGIKSFKAAQEAKTFREAIDSVKDAVSTGWMNTFEIIFGDYQEAKALWTGLANLMYDVFATSGEARNEMLEEWKKAEGRKYLLDAFANSILAIRNALAPIKEAWEQVFPPMTGERLAGLTKNLAELTSHMSISSKTAEDLRLIFKGLFTIFKGILTVVGTIAKTVIPPALTAIKIILVVLIRLGGIVAEFARDLKNTINPAELLNKAFTIAAGAGVVLYSVISDLVLKLISFSRTIRNMPLLAPIFKAGSVALSVLIGLLSQIPRIRLESIPEMFSKMKESFNNFIDTVKNYKVVQYAIGIVSTAIEKLSPKFEKLILGAKNLGLTIVDLGKKFVEGFKIGNFSEFVSTVIEKLQGLKEKISEFIENTGLFQAIFGDDGFDMKKIKDDFAKFITMLSDFSKQVGPARIAAIALSVAFLGMAGSIAKLTNSASDTLSGIKGFFGTLTKSVKNLGAKSSWLANLALLIGTIAASLALLSQIPFEDLKHGAIVLGIFAAAIMTLVAVASKISGIKSGFEGAEAVFNGMTRTLVALTGSAVLLIAAIKILDGVQLDNIIKKIGALGAIMLELSLVTAIFGRIAPKFKLGSVTLLLVAVAVNQAVSALAMLNQMNVSVADKNLVTLLAIMASLGIFAKGVGSIGLTSTVGIFLLVAFLDQLIPMIDEVSSMLDKVDMGSLKSNVEEFVMAFSGVVVSLTTGVFGKRFPAVMEFTKENPLISGLAGFLAVVTVASGIINLLGGAIKKMGFGLIAMSAALYLATFTVERFKDINISDDAFAKAIGFMVAFIGMTTIYVALGGALNRVEKGGKRANLTTPIIAMGLFFAEMAGLMYLISKATSTDGGEKAIWSAVGVMAALSACLAVMIGVTAAAKDVKMGTIASLMVGMTFIFAEVAVFSALGWDQLKDGLLAAAIVAGVLAGLILAVGGAARLAGKSAGLWKPLLAFIGVVAAIGGVIYALNTLPNVDGIQLMQTAGALGIAIAALGGTMILLAKFGGTAPRMIKLAAAMAIMSGALGVVALSLMGLTAVGSSWSTILPALTGVGLLIAELAAILITSTKLIKTEKQVERFVDIARALTLASTSMIAIGFSISLLSSYNWKSLIGAAGAIGLLFLELSVAIGILTTVIGDKAKNALAIAGSLTLACLSFVGIAAALMMIASLDTKKMQDAAWALGILFGVLSVIMAAIAAIAGATGIGAAAIIAVGGAILALGISMAAAGAAMVLASIGLTIGLNALKSLVVFIRDELPPELATTVAQSLITLAGGLKELGVSGLYLIGGAIGLGLAAVATLAMAGAIALLRIASGDTGDNLISIAGGLIELSKSGESLFSSAAAFGITGVALGLLAVPLLALSFINIVSIAVSLQMLSVGMDALANSGIKMIAGNIGLSGLMLLLIPLSAGLTAVGLALKIANPGLDQFVTICGRVANGVVSMAKMIASAVTTIINNITAMVNKMKTAGQDAVRGLTSGVSSLLPNVNSSGMKLAAKFLSGFSLISGWASPWATLVKAGKDAVRGLTNGVDSKLSDANSSGKGLANGFLGGLTGTLSDGIAKLKNKLDFGSLFGNVTKLGGASQLADEGFNILGDTLGNVEENVNDLTESMGLGENALNSYGTSAGAAGKKSGPFEGLAETIKGAVSVFKEFDRTVEMSADEMIHNLGDQLNGMIEWKNGLLNLVEKGISPELYEYLANMGQQEGYGYVMALQNASAEQIADLNQKWAQYLTMPQQTANEIANGYAVAGGKAGQAIVDKMSSTVKSNKSVEQISSAVAETAEQSGNNIGEDITGGIGEGLTDGKATAGFGAAADLAKIMMESGIRAALDSNSPAKTMYPVGEDIAAGVGEGMIDPVAQALIRVAANMLANNTITEASGKFNSSYFIPTGRQVTAGIAAGIENARNTITTKLAGLAQSTISAAAGYFSSSKFISAGRQVCAGLAQGILEGKSAVINAMAEVARDTIQEANEEFEIESPSKVFIRSGKFIDMGLALGLEKYSRVAVDAASNVSTATIQAFSKSINSVNSFIIDSMDGFDPVITPSLDLSLLNEQSNGIADIFNKGYTAKLASVNGKMFTERERASTVTKKEEDKSQNEGNTYNFIQNNNSPTALSRIDIYRSTKNQFAQFKEAIEGT